MSAFWSRWTLHCHPGSWLALSDHVVNVGVHTRGSDLYALSIAKSLEVVGAELDGMLVLCSFDPENAASASFDGACWNRQTVFRGTFQVDLDAMLRAQAFATAGSQSGHSDERGVSGD